MARRSFAGALTALALLGALPAQGASAQGGALPADTIAARQHFFGAENVDEEGGMRRDRVLLSWFSVASFAAAIDGHVVLLDSYIHKGEDAPNYVPTTTEELIALDPEAIFLGHGHFDHAATTGEIAARTGAVIIGTPEHCAQAQAEAESYGPLSQPVQCVESAASADEPGAVREIRPLGEDVEITALKHVHSAAEPPDGQGHETSLVAGAAPDPSLILLHPPGASVVEGLNRSGDEGGTILYQFRIGRFSLVWHDSAGPLRERAPAVFDALRALPATDVQVGATLGFNDPTNGMRDPVDYVTTLEPDLFFPNHHDFIAEYGASKALEGVFRRELAKRDPIDSEIRWLYDPYDYLRPSLMSFEVEAERYSDCVSRRAPVRTSNIAGIRLGAVRAEATERAGVTPEKRDARSDRWCVTGTDGSVGAAYSGSTGDAVAQIVASTSTSHHQRRIAPGDPAREVYDRLDGEVKLGRGIIRVSGHSARLFALGNGRVEALAIAGEELFERPRALDRSLRRAIEG